MDSTARLDQYGQQPVQEPSPPEALGTSERLAIDKQDWESPSAQCVRLGQHFAVRAGLVLAIFLGKRLLGDRIPPLRRRKGGEPVEAKFKLLNDPATQFKPSNPKWGIQAVEWAEHGLPEDLKLPRCPALQTFIEQLESGAQLLQPGTAAHHLFLHEKDAVFLNHGSYGAAFRPALEAQSFYRELLERHPTKFFEHHLAPMLQRVREDIAGLVGAEGRDVLLMSNATTAIATVVASLDLRRGDLLLLTSVTYPAVANMLARAAGKAGASLLEVQLPLATVQDHAAMLAAFRAAIQAGGKRLKLVVIDHIASFPPITFPVAEIAALCKQQGIKVLVDGAHAVGAVPLDLPSLGVNFYTSNLHKWLCTPKGVAFLWVNRADQPKVLPLVTSHGYRLGFQGEFYWQGTIDATPFLSVPACLAVFRAFGFVAWRRNNHVLLGKAVSVLQHSFSADIVIGDQATHACMAAIPLPSLPEFSATFDDAAALRAVLLDEHNIEVPVACWEGRLWVRISAQIYNTMADYEALALAIRSLQAPRLVNGHLDVMV